MSSSYVEVHKSLAPLRLYKIIKVGIPKEHIYFNMSKPSQLISSHNIFDGYFNKRLTSIIINIPSCFLVKQTQINTITIPIGFSKQSTLL